MSDTITDFDRMKIASEEYSDYRPNDGAFYTNAQGEEISIGTVTEVVTDDTGLKAYVVREDDGNIIVLYKGSEEPLKDGWEKDWLGNDLPIAGGVLAQNQGATD